jgi:hypothetical protein
MTVGLFMIAQEYEQWRSTQNGKPSRPALRDYWRAQDAKHGRRPDYQLWRQTQCPDSPPEKRQNKAALALAALQSKEPLIYWSALSLMPSLLLIEDECLRQEAVMRALHEKLSLEPLTAAPHSSALSIWLCCAALAGDPVGLLRDLQSLLIKAQPNWKCGRSLDLSFLQQEAWMPLSPKITLRLLVAVITKLIHLLGHDPAVAPELLADISPWCLSTWQLLRDSRPPQAITPLIEVEVLLNAASTLRCGGLFAESWRLAALALHLLPERAPVSLVQRCQVAAWTLAEAGLECPKNLRVSLDDLPFPSEPAQSEKAKELALLFRDEEDLFQHRLLREVTGDPDWQKLKACGVVLTHPLAALAWIGKKAQSYALKKQHDLLQAAARLAHRYQCLYTLGRILAEWPESAEKVISYALALRQSQRRMPVLRDFRTWQICAQHLRNAWGKLETEAIVEEETVFNLHETLLDRAVTLTRSLPAELRVLALRHLHAGRSPSRLVQALQTDPRLMQQLEHKSPIELWSISAELRERPELANCVWISVVMKGEVTSGKYSWIVQSSTGRQMKQGRLRASTAGESPDTNALIQEMGLAIQQLGGSPEWLLLAADKSLTDLPWQSQFMQAGLSARLSFIPSWEWAFRVLRENDPPKDVIFEALVPEATTAQVTPMTISGPMVQACLLLPGRDDADASTRWSVCCRPETVETTRRSLSIGRHPVIFSEGPLYSGDFAEDLTQLSLAQSCNLVLSVYRPLTTSERETFEYQMFSPPPQIPLSARLKPLVSDLWKMHGIPW